MKEWRGVIMQIANLAALVYLATHATESEMSRYALLVVGISTILSHQRARLDAGIASVLAGVTGGPGGGLAASLLVPSIPPAPMSGGGASSEKRNLRVAQLATVAASLTSFCVAVGLVAALAVPLAVRMLTGTP
jgi:hypothetical protein